MSDSDADRTTDQTDATSQAAAAAARPRVLVVEDDPFSQDMLVRRLTSRGFAVSAVSDGPSCLERVAAEAFDLILLDVNLPGLTGLQVLPRLREKYSHDALPIILVTALGDSADVIAGLEAGANDYVVKPVNLSILLARIGVWLKVKQSIGLLVEAERDRVVLETLGRACEQIAQPMTAITMMLEMLVRHSPPPTDELQSELSHVLEVTKEAGEIIHRLRTIAKSHTVPYTTRMELIGGLPAPVN